MLRFSAHLSFLSLELPFAERMEAAKGGVSRCRMRGSGNSGGRMSRRAQELGLAIVGINTAPGEAEERTPRLCRLAGAREGFRAQSRRGARLRGDRGAGHVHVLSGLIDGVAREDAEATFMRNMESGIRSAEGGREARHRRAELARPAGLFPVAAVAFAIVDHFASPWLRAMFDTYHAQIMEGDILARHRGKPLADRPYPDLRRAWPDGARFRRAEPSRDPRGDRSARLGGLHRLRIQAAHDHGRRARLDADPHRLTLEPGVVPVARLSRFLEEVRTKRPPGFVPGSPRHGPREEAVHSGQRGPSSKQSAPRHAAAGPIDPIRQRRRRGGAPAAIRRLAD